jgi:galactokinase
MGKPVVATLTETMKAFADFTYLARDKEEYVKLISKALDEDSEKLSKARISFAHTHTWENNVKAIYDAIIETEKTN